MKSLLFIPGDDERKLGKAMDCGADVVLLDLEDSVASDRKGVARDMVAEFLIAQRSEATQGRKTGPALYVRINPLDTALWEDDVARVATAAPAGLLLPKARSGDDVRTLSSRLDTLASRQDAPASHQDAPGGSDIKLIVLTSEVPVSLLRMDTYLDASPRVAGLTWGAEDLSAELGASTNRGDDGRHTSPYRLARDLCLLTACASGVEPIDTVFPNFRDLEGLQREAEEAARDGFTAKMAIHPAQVPVINAAFTPSDAAVAEARTVVAAFAAQPDAGVVAIDGEMFDRPHLARAERLLSRAS